MKIFIINGRATAGKTTFEHYVQRCDREHITIYSTITPIKIIANSFGWNGTKEPKDRKMLSDLKDLLTEWNDVPYQRVCEVIEFEKQRGTKAILIDCREPQEIDRFARDFNATTIFVRRDAADLEPSNHADANVENYDYDITIRNNGTLDDLQFIAREFYREAIEG